MDELAMALRMRNQPHRRLDPLSGRWVLVSPHRNQRPWAGLQEAPDLTPRPAHDPQCPLCAGNERAHGRRNPVYQGPYVFANDFPALLAEPPEAGVAGDDDPLFTSAPARGECRVLCFTPDHGKTLAELSVPEIEAVVDLCCEQSAELGRRWPLVQVFENKGAMMGCSNPHPHGQVWATEHLNDTALTEDRHQRAYHATHGRALLADLATREAADGARTVVQTEGWLAVVPYWATWPFETLLLPRFPVQRLPELQRAARQDLALALRQLTCRYDNLFGCAFPYSMGWHGAPFDGQPAPHWQLHAHFYPPLLRSASVRKFMVGYELLAELQRDITPEQAAERLRKVSAVHYLSARTNP